MKKILLIVFFTVAFLFTAIFSGYSAPVVNAMAMTDELFILQNQYPATTPDTSIRPAAKQRPEEIRVFPNPTTDYFSVNGMENLKEVVVINLVGREVKRFSASIRAKYDVSDLNSGLYLVRLIGEQGKAVKTVRLSKR